MLMEGGLTLGGRHAVQYIELDKNYKKILLWRWVRVDVGPAQSAPTNS